jgi:hypothetical protein
VRERTQGCERENAGMREGGRERERESAWMRDEETRLGSFHKSRTCKN